MKSILKSIILVSLFTLSLSANATELDTIKFEQLNTYTANDSVIVSDCYLELSTLENEYYLMPCLFIYQDNKWINKVEIIDSPYIMGRN